MRRRTSAFVTAGLAAVLSILSVPGAASAEDTRSTPVPGPVAAEKLLVCCYEARDIIDAARSPVSFDNEGKERPYSIGETEAQVRLFNRYWTPAERLINRGEFFARLATSQYSAKAYLGNTVTYPVKLILNKRNQIIHSARMLVLQSDYLFEISTQRQKLQRIIWSMDDDDEIKIEIDAAVEQVEAICRPVLEHASRFRSSFDWLRGRSVLVWQCLRKSLPR
jgi:hypothetical protein